MMGLTPLQSKVLDYLRTYSADHGAMPTLEEIAAFMGVSSKSGAHRVLTALEERGCIRRMAGKQRAIELVEALELSRLSSSELIDLAAGAAAELKRRGVRFMTDNQVAA